MKIHYETCLLNTALFAVRTSSEISQEKKREVEDLFNKIFEVLEIKHREDFPSK